MRFYFGRASARRDFKGSMPVSMLGSEHHRCRALVGGWPRERSGGFGAPAGLSRRRYGLQPCEISREPQQLSTATIAVTKERRFAETRVAVTPDSVKKLIGLGFAVTIEAGAGVAASIPDAEYLAAGATIAPDAKAALAGADLVFMVRGPDAEQAAAMKSGALLAALLNPYQNRETLDALARAGVSAFAMEFVPRITRAQVMDALSSQANLAGYRAVIEAAEAYGRVFPMMMTAASITAR